MNTRHSPADIVFKIKAVILLLEIALPFGLYYALQSGHNWLAMVCLALIVMGLVGVIILQ